jgi:hypothetical protein
MINQSNGKILMIKTSLLLNPGKKFNNSHTSTCSASMVISLISSLLTKILEKFLRESTSSRALLPTKKISLSGCSIKKAT